MIKLFQLLVINSLNKILHPDSKGPDVPLFLVIIGDYGAGKTLLLNAATQKLAAQHVPVFFSVSHRLRWNLNSVTVGSCTLVVLVVVVAVPPVGN